MWSTVRAPRSLSRATTVASSVGRKSRWMVMPCAASTSSSTSRRLLPSREVMITLAGRRTAGALLGLLLGALYYRGDESDSLALELGSIALGIAALIAVFVCATSAA